MDRRTFLKTGGAASALGFVPPLAVRSAADALTAKVTRVRIYRPPDFNPLFNQSNMLVTVETDAGLTRIGEGRSKDTLEKVAGTLIGQNPFNTERCWAFRCTSCSAVRRATTVSATRPAGRYRPARRRTPA